MVGGNEAIAVPMPDGGCRASAAPPAPTPRQVVPAVAAGDGRPVLQSPHAGRWRLRATVADAVPALASARVIPAQTRTMSTSGLDAVIWGITNGGRVFRPSDWAERLAGLTSAFGHDQKLAYSPLVRPVTIGGVKAVIVGHELETVEPRLHQFLLGFARDNELQVARAEGALAAPQRLAPPAVAKVTAQPRPAEPREPI